MFSNEEQFILDHDLGHSQATFTLRGGIHEKFTLLNKLYQVKVPVGGGGLGWVKKEKITHLFPPSDPE